MLDLELLRSFVSVVDAGGFTRAGERVHRTQSTVSQQIRRLEEDIGQPLLDRNGKDVTPDQTLSYIIANLPPGSRTPIVLLRDGKRMTLTATVGKRPPEDQLAQQSFDPNGSASPAPQGEAGSGLLEKSLGIRAIPLTAQIAGQLGLDQGAHGLVVTDVDANSDAGQKGFTRGVVILSVNGQPLTSAAQLEAAVKAAQAAGRSAILLRVRAPGQPEQSVPIRLR